MVGHKDNVKHKRRYCRIENCTKIVKSQGLCQRHGAKTRKCKVDGCEKQAQGNFDSMCKLHFKITKTQLIAKPVTEEDMSPEPVGESVYDSILPESIGWADDTDAMPLVKHLKDGFERQKPRGWHRNEERRSRGLPPVPNPAVQLEGWERELVWMEICLLSGCPQSSFRHLARSWGRDKGFHMVLAQFICERRGNVERKKRVKGDSLTKKTRRAPLELAPSGEELPSVLELDDVELDMFGAFDLSSTHEIEDPTVNFTHIPNFGNLGKRGKRRPMDMSPMEMQQRDDDGMASSPTYHHHQPPLHHDQSHYNNVGQGYIMAHHHHNLAMAPMAAVGKANMQGNMQGLMQGNMHGNMQGNMQGNMHGNMQGNMQGNMHGNMQGHMQSNMHGNMQGNMQSNMHGNLQGNMHGNMMTHDLGCEGNTGPQPPALYAPV
jgi:hypothetical protein